MAHIVEVILFFGAKTPPAFKTPPKSTLPLRLPALSRPCSLSHFGFSLSFAHSRSHSLPCKLWRAHLRQWSTFSHSSSPSSSPCSSGQTLNLVMQKIRLDRMLPGGKGKKIVTNWRYIGHLDACEEFQCDCSHEFFPGECMAMLVWFYRIFDVRN